MFRRMMLVWLGLLAAGSAIAADAELSATVLDAVVVTAGRIEEKVLDQTMSVLVIDAEEIASSPARDLGDLLAEKGVGYIQKNPGALTTVAIRGFRTNAQQSDLLGYSLVLLNGRRAGTGNMAMILTRDIERIEIIRGPGAVQYGSAAMGGVINVITREGQGPFRADVFGTLGSYDYAEGGALVSGGTGSLDYSLGFARSTMNDYKTGDGDRYHNTGYAAKQSYSVNLGWRFLDDHRVGVLFNGTKIDAIGTPNYLSMNDLDDYRDSDYRSFDISYTGATADHFLGWNLRYFKTDIEDLSYDPVASNPDFWDDGGLSFQSQVDQQGAQVQVSGEFDFMRLVAGVDWYDYDVKSTFSPYRTTFENTAGFLLAKGFFLRDRLIVDAGLRYDYAEVEMVAPAGKTEDHDNWITSFGLAYLLNDNWKVRAHYGEAFKVPGADQLAADYSLNYGWGPTQYRGNPALDPESSRTYEVGVDYSDSMVSASFGYFLTDFEDKITQVVIPGGYTWTNSGEVELSGFEAQISADIVLLGREDLRLKPYLNATWLDRYRDLDTHEDLTYVNKINASSGFTLSLPKDFSARLNITYHGRKRVEDWQNNVWPAPVEVIETGGFTVVDLGLSKQLFDSSCSVSANVGNLFAKNYAYVEGYPMPGRTYQVRVNYSF